MGGMIALRAVLRHPGFFTGLVLNGPLIVPGPQVTGCLDLTAAPLTFHLSQIGPIDFRSSPMRTFISKTVLQFLSWFIPNVPLGRPNLNIVTRWN